MPLYEYQCQSCEERFERIQKFSDPLVSECPSCGGEVEKLISSPAIRFKGSGFYITDYADKSKSPETATQSSDSKDSSEKASKKDEKSKKSDTGDGSKAKTATAGDGKAATKAKNSKS